MSPQYPSRPPLRATPYSSGGYPPAFNNPPGVPYPAVPQHQQPVPHPALPSQPLAPQYPAATPFYSNPTPLFPNHAQQQPQYFSRGKGQSMTLTIHQLVPFLFVFQLLTDLLVIYLTPTSFLVCQEILGTFLHSQLSSTMETHIITTSTTVIRLLHISIFRCCLLFFL